MKIKQKGAAAITVVIIIFAIVYGFYICADVQRTFSPGSYAEEVRELTGGEYKIFAEIIAADKSTVFQKGMQYDDGTFVSSEISGVGFYGNRLYLVSDQPIPGFPSFFDCQYQVPLNFRSGRFLGGSLIRSAYGFEDIAVSPNLKYLFLLTSFERLPNMADSAFFSNNVIQYLPINHPDSVFYLPRKTPVRRDLIQFRKQIQKALSSKLYPNGPTYFKAEALTVVSDSLLLIGISRMGPDPYAAVYQAIILEAEYYMGEDNRVMMTSSVKESYQLFFDDHPELTGPLYITGMDYDYYNKALFFTTAYNRGSRAADVGGYLWRIDFSDYQLHRPAELVYSAPDVPLHFAHKPSGVAVIDEETVLVICDDERITGEPEIFDPRKEFYRQLNESAYYVLEIFK